MGASLFLLGPIAASTGPFWKRALDGRCPSIPNAENWRDGKLPSQTDCLKLQYLPNSFTVGVFRRSNVSSVPPPVTEWTLVHSRQDNPRGLRLPRIGPPPRCPRARADLTIACRLPGPGSRCPCLRTPGTAMLGGGDVPASMQVHGPHAHPRLPNATPYVCIPPAPHTPQSGET